ncbi:MAG: hypothetical protein FWC47_09340 [Oscillospiraceae bacterium]|nr:hypothetical protein [Oscillospiraceae bacterium]
MLKFNKNSQLKLTAALACFITLLFLSISKALKDKAVPNTTTMPLNTTKVPSTSQNTDKSPIPVNQISIPETQIVYWTDSGKSYHLRKDCPTLSRSTNIKSGPFSSCLKDDPCDLCVK